jgi:hypothetical protein
MKLQRCKVNLLKINEEVLYSLGGSGQNLCDAFNMDNNRDPFTLIVLKDALGRLKTYISKNPFKLRSF